MIFELNSQEFEDEIMKIHISKSDKYSDILNGELRPLLYKNIRIHNFILQLGYNDTNPLWASIPRRETVFSNASKKRSDASKLISELIPIYFKIIRICIYNKDNVELLHYLYQLILLFYYGEYYDNKNINKYKYLEFELSKMYIVIDLFNNEKILKTSLKRDKIFRLEAVIQNCITAYKYGIVNYVASNNSYTLAYAYIYYYLLSRNLTGNEHYGFLDGVKENYNIIKDTHVTDIPNFIKPDKNYSTTREKDPLYIAQKDSNIVSCIEYIFKNPCRTKLIKKKNLNLFSSNSRSS